MSPKSSAYQRAYYETHCGEVYERTPTWLTFFGRCADRIVAEIAPASALDAGCAMGFLVEALRDRGVDARGIDISDYAIAQARKDVRPHLRVADLTAPLDGHWDLITCIEVLEHMEPDDAARAVANLCAHTDDVLLSSTPHDHREATHVNVQPLERWIEIFLRNDFVRDLDYDASYLTHWAVRLRRRRDPLERQLVAYERRLWPLLNEKHDRDLVVMQQAEEIAAVVARAAALEEEVGSCRAEASESTAVLEAEVRGLRAEAERLEVDLRDADAQLRRACATIQELTDRVDAAEAGSAAGLVPGGPDTRLGSVDLRRIEVRVRHAARRAAPVGTRRGAVLSVSARAARDLRRGVRSRGGRGAPPDRAGVLAVEPALSDVDERWNHYLSEHDPGEDDLRRMRRISRAWSERPLVSVIMPTYDPEAWYLREAIDSVRGQAYESWELCIADDATPGSVVADTVAEYAEDPRIRLVRRAANGGIAAASASAVELARGDYITFLDHDDVLRPHALFETVRHLLTHSGDDLVYSDEDKLDPLGRRVGAHLKPDWSPELMESCNYVCHLTVMRRTLFDDAGGFRPGFDGSQDYDLFLRATERARGVAHLPLALYSWRMLPRSAAASTAAKPEAYVAAKRALTSALERREEHGWVDDGVHLGYYHVRRRILGAPTVAVVIPTRDRSELLERAVNSVLAERGPRDVRVVIVDNGSTDATTRLYLDTCGHTVVRAPGAFNFSRLVNRGVDAAGDIDHVLLLNNDVAATRTGWLDALLEHSQRSGVGAVGARLLDPDGHVQAEGVRVGGQGHPADHLDLTGYFAYGLCTRTVSAVSAACLMVKRSAWGEVGGFDEGLRVVYNDVDFCLRLRRAGYRNIYTPVAELIHTHSATRGGHHPGADVRTFLDRWNPTVPGFDPYVSPHVWSYQPVEYRHVTLAARRA